MRELFLSIAVLNPKDLVPCIYLATNRLGPAYEGLELGIGDSIVMKAVVEATGKSMKSLKEEYTKVGDLGLIAQASTNTVRTLKAPKPLTIASLFETLLTIAKMTGHEVMKKKQDKIRHLLVCCRESEAQFVIKMLQGKMRINLGPKSVVAGLSHAYAYAEHGNKNPGDERLKKAVQLVNAAFSQLPSWEKVIDALNTYGLDALPSHCKLTIGIPVEPMLAQPTKGTKEILERLAGHELFTAEYKYDGERAQVHRMEDGTTKIYSRNLEDNTGKFPDIIGYLPHAMKGNLKSFILDCEAVAFDRETQKILPFQILSTRARKEVSMENIKVNVCLFVFDLLYLNGEVCTF
jgi:DNA ligase 1